MSQMQKQRIPGARLPWIFVGFFAVVFIANGILVYAAVQSWTGVSSEQHYLKGLDHNKTLQDVAQQQSRGWTADLSVNSRRDGAVEVQMDLANARKNAVAGARVAARFIRPTHEGHDFELQLQDVGRGRYRGVTTPPLPGQWDVQVMVEHRSGTYRMIRRVVLP